MHEESTFELLCFSGDEVIDLNADWSISLNVMFLLTILFVFMSEHTDKFFSLLD